MFKKCSKITILLFVASNCLLIPPFLFAQAELVPYTKDQIYPFFVDYACFLKEDDTQYLEVYYQIANDQLRFQKKGGYYVASFEVEVSLFSENGELINGEYFSEDLIAQSFEETRLKSQILIKTLKIPKVAPGRYRLVVTIRDLDSQEVGNYSKWIKIRDYRKDRGFSISDRVFGMRVDYQNNQRVIRPNPSRIYSDFQPNLILYFELYNHTADSQSVHLEVELVSPSGYIRDKIERVIPLRPFNILESHYSFNVSFYPSGTYKVRIKAKGADTPSEKLLVQDYFLVDNSASWVPGNYEKTVEMLKYIATEEELEQLRRAKGEERLQAWVNFWKSRDPTPGTPENEVMTEYYRRIEYANAHFSGVNKEGWLTDMGRIYIKYGPPDEIERYSFQLFRNPRIRQSPRVQGKPYEYWYYYQLRRKFYFVDRNGTGEYYLEPLPWNDPYNLFNPGIE